MKTRLLLLLAILGVTSTAYAYIEYGRWTTINSNGGAALSDSNKWKRMLRCWVMQYPTSQYTCTGPGNSGAAQCSNAVNAVFWEGERYSTDNQNVRHFQIHQNRNGQDVIVAAAYFKNGSVDLNTGYFEDTDAQGHVSGSPSHPRWECDFPTHRMLNFSP